MSKPMSEHEVESQIKVVTTRLLLNEAKEIEGRDPVLSFDRKVQIAEDSRLLQELTEIQKNLRETHPPPPY